MNQNHNLRPYRSQHKRRHHRSENTLRKEIESELSISPLENFRDQQRWDKWYDDLYCDDLYDDYTYPFALSVDELRLDNSHNIRRSESLESWQFDNLGDYYSFDDDLYDFYDTVYRPNEFFVYQGNGKYSRHYTDAIVPTEESAKEFPVETCGIDIANELHHELQTEEHFFEHNGWVFSY